MLVPRRVRLEARDMTVTTPGERPRSWRVPGSEFLQPREILRVTVSSYGTLPGTGVLRLAVVQSTTTLFELRVGAIVHPP